MPPTFITPWRSARERPVGVFPGGDAALDVTGGCEAGILIDVFVDRFDLQPQVEELLLADGRNGFALVNRAPTPSPSCQNSI
jgi:hypothetical protein